MSLPTQPRGSLQSTNPTPRRLPGAVIFVALVALIIITAIPYGTVEPWWKSAFVCAVFLICIAAIVERPPRISAEPLLLPMFALSALAFVQSLSTQISADPFQSAFFALQTLALTAFLALLYRYADSERRIRILVYTIIGVAVISAIFGILRQTTQHETGFILPLLRPNQGFAQFINKNHFVYLMEMAFGLGLGIILVGAVKKDHLMIYVALLLPILIALVLANSRGGILAILVQIVTAALLFASRSAKFTTAAALKATLIVVIGGVLAATLWVDNTGALEGASRSEIWNATLKMFAANPILGVGLGGYWIGITPYHNASGRMVPQEAHNDYLELLSSGGLIGFAIGIWFVVIVIRAIRRNLIADRGFMRAARMGAVLGLAGVAAHSLVDFGLHIMVNAIVFVTLIMIATTNKIIDLNPQKQ